MSPDGVSYLDLADAWRQGDWHSAISAYWSPLYSWLLAAGLAIFRPSPVWEDTVVHLINFLVLVGSLAAFQFFVNGWVRARSWRREDATFHAWIHLGYALFLWASAFLVTPADVSPDLLVFLMIFAISGLLVRIHIGAPRKTDYALLGLALGLGYLIKSPMLPLAVVVFGSLILFRDGRRARLRGAGLALLCFGLVAAPWITVLSRAKGRFTFSDTAKLNYFWFVEGMPPYAGWHGEIPGAGVPVHAPQYLASVALEFGGPVGGTYPLWYDPAYWHKGIRIDLGRISIESLRRSVLYPYLLIFVLQAGLIAGWGVLVAGVRRRKEVFHEIAAHAWLLALPLSACVMYAMVHLERRFLGAFLVIIWMVLYAVVLAHAPEIRGRRKSVGLAIALISVIVLPLAGVPAAAADVIRDVVHGDLTGTSPDLELANALSHAGLKRGERIAVIGDALPCYYARVAGLRITAQVLPEDEARFWALDAASRMELERQLSEAGVRAILAGHAPPEQSAGGWAGLGKTGYYLRGLGR